MSIKLPQTTQEYHLPKLGSYQNLAIRKSSVTPPAATDVLVKVHAVSLQYRDFAIVTQIYPMRVKDDLVPCSDMAGEILSVGDAVHGWKVGDRVCANFSTEHLFGEPSDDTHAATLGGGAHGVLTQYRTFPAHALVAIPKHFSYEEASTLPCATLTAYNALNGPVPVKAGDYVLVLGTGGVSIAGLQIAVASGATVIATSSSDKKLAIASKLGAKHLINYKHTPNWDEEVRRIVPSGVDHVIEVGGEGTIGKSLGSIKYGGWVHLIGFVSQDTSKINVVQQTMMCSGYTRGIAVGSVAQFKDLVRLICANPETTRPVIDKVFPFEEAKAAYAHLESQKFVGKIVIKVSKD